MVPALRAALPNLAGVALGPRGNRLVIAASLVVSLDRDGDLTWIAGSKQFVPWCRTCNIGEGNFHNVDQLAYDGVGDLSSLVTTFRSASALRRCERAGPFAI